MPGKESTLLSWFKFNYHNEASVLTSYVWEKSHPLGRSSSMYSARSMTTLLFQDTRCFKYTRLGPLHLSRDSASLEDQPGNDDSTMRWRNSHVKRCGHPASLSLPRPKRRKLQGKRKQPSSRYLGLTHVYFCWSLHVLYFPSSASSNNREVEGHDIKKGLWVHCPFQNVRWRKFKNPQSSGFHLYYKARMHRQ